MSEENKDQSGIYSFRNKKNGKVYVGQSKNVLTRKKQHERGDTNNSRRFHNAMKKYGASAFEFTVLEYCSNESLNAREVHWLNKLNSLYPNGYNLTSGGGAFQKHHEETKKKFSENQKKRIADGTHDFVTKEFIEANIKRQTELARLGLHSSQQPKFQEKRNKTIQQRITETGAFFKHSPETIALYKKQQGELYSKGIGRFQDQKLIDKNKILVKKRLAEGTHHTQQPDWSERAKKAATSQMKQVFLAIRTDAGETIEIAFPSINEVVRQLGARKGGISMLCNKAEGIVSVGCNLGKVIKGTIGTSPDWSLSDLQKMPDSSFTKSIAVKFTIQTLDGKLIIKTYQGIREGCRDLDADKSAVRWVLKGQKYKSTKCNLGRIIKVEEAKEVN